MKFLVTRTSSTSNEDPECKEAFEGENLFPDGSSKKGWFVELETMEELKNFISNYGAIIVGIDSFNDCCSIEIYDNYRE